MYKRMGELMVMVVDPNMESQQEMFDIIQSFGAKEIVCAEDGESALHMLFGEEQLYVDLVLTAHDLAEGGMNGSQFVGKLKSVAPDKIVIMYSSCPEITAHLSALIIGSSDYIKKEGNWPERFRDKLFTWMDIARQQNELGGKGGERNPL